MFNGGSKPPPHNDQPNTSVRHSENLVFRVNLPQILLNSLIIRQYYCVFHLSFGNKFTPTKLLCTRKWMIFWKKRQKTTVTHYYGKSAVIGQFLTMAHTRMEWFLLFVVVQINQNHKKV